MAEGVKACVLCGKHWIFVRIEPVLHSHGDTKHDCAGM
jgi:hypothetical protein